MSKLVIVDPNAFGGHNDFCRSLSLLLSGKDPEIIYINRESKSDNSPNYEHIAVGYPDESFKNKIKSYINIFRQLKNFIEKGYVIHFQDITSYMSLVVIFLLLLPPYKKNFYYTLHNVKPHEKSIKSSIEYKLVYLLLRNKAFKKVFYHFEFIQMEDELAVNNIPETVRKKMVFVPHHMFKNQIKNITNRQIVDNVDDEIIILFFGAIRKNKGLLEFFSLINKIDLDTKRIKFIVAGNFTEAGYNESDLRKTLDHSEYDIKLQIENRFIEDDEKEAMFNSAHYILLPYIDDFLAQSGVVMDAYQYKKPLIVSSNPSLKYLVTHELTGYLYDQENLKSFLEEKIHDQEQYDLYLKNIDDVLVNKYSDEPIRKHYMDTYALGSVSWV